MITPKGTIKGNFLTGDKPTQQQFADLIESSVGCIGKLSANLNITTDQAISLSGGGKYIVTDIIMVNASGNVTTANQGQFWSGANKSGTQYFNTFAFGETMQLLTTANKFLNISNSGIQSPGGYFDVITSLIFSLGNPQGSALTCDIYVFGIPLP